MAITATVYKNGIKLGSGTISGTSITGYSAFQSRTTQYATVSGQCRPRWVMIACTGGVSSNGTYRTQIIGDNGAGTLTVKNAVPFT